MSFDNQNTSNDTTTADTTLVNDFVLPDCEIGPIMPLDTITYIQSSFWDNGPEPKFGPKGNKSGAPRFKICIEAWNVPVDQIQKTPHGMQFKRFVQLRDAHAFIIKVVDKNRRTGKISQEYGKFLGDVVYNETTNRETDLFGVIFDRNHGWNYHEFQFVRVRFDVDSNPIVDLFAHNDLICIDNFRSVYSGKITHKGFIDKCGYNEHRRSKDK